MAKWVCFGTSFFTLIHWIQIRDEKNLTFVDCWNKISRPENGIKLPKDSLYDSFQDSYYKILSQQLTHARSYISFQQSS